MISALFVTKDSIYKKLGIDSWDINRDALKWPGGNSIIAHPPCRLWGKLSHFSTAPPEEKELAIWSVKQIQKFGGVLEHPVSSRLWKAENLPYPNEGYDKHGGFSICIYQSWFGHLAQKKTLLYIVGCKKKHLPKVELSFDLVECTISSSLRKTNKKEISHKQRLETPIKLAKWLIEVALICNNEKIKTK